MKTIHLTLQGKGGVGKSLVASLLCQYLGQNNPVRAIDTDPVNHTLGGYKALNATELEIRNGDSIDPRKFDELMELVCAGEEDGHVVIDNGAATFMPLCAWMIENQTIDMWKDAGMRVLLHCVITGGQAMRDTVDGLAALAGAFNTEIIVWLNRYFGEILFKGKGFETFPIFEKNRDKIAAVIRLPLKTKETFGKDLEELFVRRQTFADAAEDATLPVMVRHRLKIWWNEVCAEIDKSNLF